MFLPVLFCVCGFIAIPPMECPIVNTYDVEICAGKDLIISGEVAQAGTNVSHKGAIALLRVKNSAGGECALKGVGWSQKLRSQYVYLPCTNGTASFDKKISLPKDASRLELSLARFYNDWDLKISSLKISAEGNDITPQGLATIGKYNLGVTEGEFRSCIRSVVFGPQKTAPVKDVLNGQAYGEDITLPIDWTGKSLKFNKNGYNISGFIFLDKVVAQYERTGDENLLSVIVAYVEDFMEKNKEPDEFLRTKNWVWYDDSIARRVQRFSYYYRYFADVLPSKVYGELKKSLDRQSDVLQEDKYYRAKHNHGMFQDLALITYALLVCDDEGKRERCIEVACKRMRQYFEYIFTEDGVHKEHSPGYEREVQNVIRVSALLLSAIRPEFCKYLNSLCDASTLHLLALTRPNGFIAPIGDSRKLTNAICPPDDIVFPYGGYAVFRSSYRDAPDVATWILFMAATHNHTHKHSDDLSFLLYHRGDFITEGGMRDYNYLDAKTQYAYSGYAHNVLCIDDKDFPVLIRKSGFRECYPPAFKTKITSYDITNDVKYVAGQQERFKGIVQNRSLTYDKHTGRVSVNDVLDMKRKNAKATLLFHVTSGISIQKTDVGLEFSRNGRLFATMKVRCDRSHDLKVYTSAPPPYGNLLFEDEYKQGIEGSLIKIDVQCEKGLNSVTTEFELK